MAEASVSTEVSPLGMFDDPRFARLALEHAAEWKAADPFPHVVIDNFFNEDVAQAVERDFPVLDSIDWVVRDNKNNIRRFQHDETKLGPMMRSILRELNSRQFLLFSLTTISFRRCVRRAARWKTLRSNF